MQQPRLQRPGFSAFYRCVEESRRNLPQIFERRYLGRYLRRSHVHRSRDHSVMKALVILKLPVPSETTCIKQQPSAVLQRDRGPPPLLTIPIPTRGPPLYVCHCPNTPPPL